MSKGLILLHICLALLAFLVMLNGYLLGKYKTLIDVALSAAIVFLLGICGFSFGWTAALISGLMYIVYGTATKPLVRLFANKLYRF